MLTLKFDKDKRYQLLTESGEDLFSKWEEYGVQVKSINIFMDHKGPEIQMQIVGHGLSVTVGEDEVREAMVMILREAEQ